jgi:hypothetical protein
MSDTLRCNHCTLKRIEREAARRGATVDCHRMTIREEAQELGMTMPEHQKLTGNREYRAWYIVRVSDRPEPIASFMELTADCAC